MTEKRDERQDEEQRDKERARQEADKSWPPSGLESKTPRPDGKK